jgi:hypothetical protein
MSMRTNILTSAAIAAVVIAGAALSSAGSAAAMPMAKSLSLANATANVETVQWRGRGGWRGGGWRGPGPFIGGLAAGALLGGALAYPGYYGYGYAPAYYPPPGYYPPGYAYGGDEMYEGEGGGDAQAYCMQRFRSYNPRLGTYLGNDGARHPCP